jgi:hypothetical protein
VNEDTPEESWAVLVQDTIELVCMLPQGIVPCNKYPADSGNRNVGPPPGCRRRSADDRKCLGPGHERGCGREGGLNRVRFGF